MAQQILTVNNTAQIGAEIDCYLLVVSTDTTWNASNWHGWSSPWYCEHCRLNNGGRGIAKRVIYKDAWTGNHRQLMRV